MVSMLSIVSMVSLKLQSITQDFARTYSVLFISSQYNTIFSTHNDSSNIGEPFQFGLKMTTAQKLLLNVTDSLRCTADLSQPFVLILFNFSDDFNTIDQNILFQNLNIFIALSSISYDESYYYDRRPFAASLSSRSRDYCFLTGILRFNAHAIFNVYCS